MVCRSVQRIASLFGVRTAAIVARSYGMDFRVTHAILLPFCSHREVAKAAAMWERPVDPIAKLRDSTPNN